jgi:hypothetical protein
MEPEMTKLAELVLNWLKSTGDLVAEQAPLLAKEIWRYGLYGMLLGMAIGLVALVVAIRTLIYMWGRVDEWNRNNEDGKIFVGVLTIVGFGVLGIISMIANASNLLLILCAPRLYVLQQLKDLMG